MQAIVGIIIGLLLFVFIGSPLLDKADRERDI